jgi:hypothetical protein
MTMRQIVLMLGAVCLVMACGAGMWIAARPPIEPFLVPEAIDVLVNWPTLHTVELSYREPTPYSTWHEVLASRLIANGWTARTPYYAEPTNPPKDIYFHISSLLGIRIVDQAEITMNAGIVRINVRRWYISPWGRCCEVAVVPLCQIVLIGRRTADGRPQPVVNRLPSTVQRSVSTVTPVRSAPAAPAA